MRTLLLSLGLLALTSASAAAQQTQPQTALQPSQPSVTQPAQPVAAQADGKSGPVISLPAEETPDSANPAAAPSKPALPRDYDPTMATGQAFSTDLGSGRRIPIGAYGETHLVMLKNDTQFTLRRIVLFFGHHFTDWASVYSELEVENVSRFEIEQSYLELQPFRKVPIGFRAGLVLLPLSIVNLYHEPPVFHSVDRPTMDQLIIPTTWREFGAGVFGSIVDGLRYQVYVVTGADGSKFSADQGISPGLSRGFVVNTQNAAVTGRINYSRILGFDIAASFYYGSANQKEQNLEGIRLGIVEADARFQRYGMMLRAQYARTFIQGADRITQVIRQSTPTASAIGSQGQGFYGEAGYNVLYPIQNTTQQLILFGRYEYVDTRAVVAEVADPGTSEALQFFTAGLSYRPILELAFKFDYRRTLKGNDGTGGNDRISFGAAFMY